MHEEHEQPHEVASSSDIINRRSPTQFLDPSICFFDPRHFVPMHLRLTTLDDYSNLSSSTHRHAFSASSHRVQMSRLETNLTLVLYHERFIIQINMPESNQLLRTLLVIIILLHGQAVDFPEETRSSQDNSHNWQHCHS